MSIINSQPLIGASGQGGYFLTKSLRFRSSASAYLNRTPASASNRQTWTWSAWVKPSLLTAPYNMTLFGADNGSDTSLIAFTGTINTPTYQMNIYNGNGAVIRTTQYFRDPSAWYHIVVVSDTTNATASNRTRLYVNGVQVTAFDSASYPAQNGTGSINSVTEHLLGRQNGTTRYFDGYLTEVNFIDGQALTPSSFGETSTSTGAWIPKKYTGTYGTNGFYLPFTDVATTSGSNAGLGKDFSGNGNYWTTNNISVTSGSTYDSMKDVPTLTDTDTANYCVWNPLAVGTNITTASGNLNATASSNSNAMLQGTFGITSGKWYWEVTLSSGTSAWAGSIIKSTAGLNYSSLSSGDAYSYSNDGSKYNGQTSTSYGNTYTTNDVISVAYNADTGKIWYAKNGTWQASGDPAAGTNEAYSGISGTYMPSALLNSATGIANFGQRPFTYTPPTGFVALNTFNLPTPTIGATASSQAGKYFNTVLYTGNGGSQSVTGVGFQPDFTWVKVRSSTQNHSFNDAVRGAGYYLVPNATAAERLQGEFDSFDSDGFSLTYDAAEGDYNASTKTYVAWNWKANGSGSSNTAGSITSTVSANTTAGFSIVTYTGTGANATVGHGLGVAPSMIIVKSRTSISPYGSWAVYHVTQGNNKGCFLNTTAAVNSQPNLWNSTTPTSTVFSIGTDQETNYNTANYVAYCFAQVAGYSAFGSYTGNGSSDGTFVFTGFRPAFIMIKRTDSTADWIIWDKSRPNYNTTYILYPNGSYVEDTSGSIGDILSNGFKARSTALSSNASGSTYIYMAFAEFPFRYSLAR